MFGPQFTRNQLRQNRPMSFNVLVNQLQIPNNLAQDQTLLNKLQLKVIVLLLVILNVSQFKGVPYSNQNAFLFLDVPPIQLLLQAHGVKK